jgi:hypothetical protein
MSPFVVELDDSPFAYLTVTQTKLWNEKSFAAKLHCRMRRRTAVFSDATATLTDCCWNGVPYESDQWLEILAV